MLDGKYRIERLLATGGMGAVYLGTHVGLRKRVAIKVLNPQLSTEAMIERFHREAITASQIGHEGIAQVTDIGTSDEGEPFLVMEYLEGESLAARLKVSGPLPIDDACELGCAILSPLAAAHRAGIVHRDLKPDNVFLVRQSRGEMIKLLDFGISRFTGLEPDFRLTATGLVLGTPYYMSPEQARGDNTVSPASDLYAFGVMLYEMLVGDVPIRAENYNQLIYRVTISDYRRPRERRPDLPEELEDLILQAMAQAPGDRPASATAMEQALMPLCRPLFRQRMTGRISTPGLVLRTPPPADGSRGDTPSRPRFIAGGIDYALYAGVTEPGHPAPPVPGDSEAWAARPAGEAEGSGSRSLPGIPDRAAGTVPMIAAQRGRIIPIAIGIAIFAAAAGGAAVIAHMASNRSDTHAIAQPAPPAPPVPQATIGSGSASSTPTRSPAVDPLGSAAAAAAVDHGPTAPATSAAKVTLQLAVEPADAVVLVDGAPVTGPELVVARDDKPHRLFVSAVGYLTYAAPLRFDEDRHLSIQLKRAVVPIRKPIRKPVRPDKPDGAEGAERIDPDSPYSPKNRKR